MLGECMDSEGAARLVVYRYMVLPQLFARTVDFGLRRSNVLYIFVDTVVAFDLTRLRD